MAVFDNFLKLDIRAGTIISAKIFKKAKKPAYQLEIDFGEANSRLYLGGFNPGRLRKRRSGADHSGAKGGKRGSARLNKPFFRRR